MNLFTKRREAGSHTTIFWEMVKLKCYTFKRATMQVQINHLPWTSIDREKGQHVHTSQKWRMRSTNITLLWWRYGKGSSKKEPWIKDKQKTCAKVVQNFAIRNPLQEVCSSIWVEKRWGHFSFYFNEVTDTTPKKGIYFLWYLNSHPLILS